jgi:predicted enzyme related to lactoylglutathione lyase
VIFNGERSNGGMTKPPPGVPSNWFPYFGVDDVDATIESARAAGGNPFIGPIDVPNGGRFALIMDPQGAAFAVLSSDNYDD